MSFSGDLPTPLGAGSDAAARDYRPLSRGALAALLLGLLSCLSFLDPLLWSVPAVAVLLAAWTLRAIVRSDGHLGGRRLALAGLALAAFFGTAAPTTWYVHRWLLRRQSRPFAESWFHFLATGQPHKAHQLTYQPRTRQPLDETLWDFYRDNSQDAEELREYVDGRLVRTLLALGDRDEVRFYTELEPTLRNDLEVIRLVYAVTYEASGGKQTFFVQVNLQRYRDPARGHSPWMIRETVGIPSPLAG